jgi:hypothetical protein
MEYTERISEKLAVVGVINSQLANNTTLSSGWINMNVIRRLLAILNLGATDTTVDFKMQSATSSAGANSADISGKVITQLSGTDDNKQAEIEIKAEEVGALGATRQWVRVQVIIGNGVTGANVGVIVLGAVLRYTPGADYDLTTVAQIVP